MALYGYPLQKQLVLSYEKTLADLLGFTAASDSLEKCMAETSRLSYGMPEIDPARRVFIVYSDIERTTPSVYNARNPIPENETDQYGTVYRIQLGAFQQKQPVSIFKAFPPYATTGLRRGVTVTVQVLSASCRRPRLLGPN